MRGFLTFAALVAVSSAPALSSAASAEDVCDEGCNVRLAVLDFFAALRSADKTALATQMVPDGTIFVHNRMDPENPRIDVVPVADHLARWERSDRVVDEEMIQRTVLVDGDMAQVWGPYYFTVDGEVSHCGINSLSMVRTDDGWKVANTSFTMEAPETCDAMVAEIDEAMRLDQ